MVPKENVGECSNNLNTEVKQGNGEEWDHELPRHSASSHGDMQLTDEHRAKKTSRGPQKFTRKQAVENLTRPTKSTSERQQSNKLQCKTSNTNRKKSGKANKSFPTTKNHSDQKAENLNVGARTTCTSDSSEGADEKIVEDKLAEEIKEIDILDEAPSCQSVGTDNETVDTEYNSLDDEKTSPSLKMEEVELRIEKLEEELREVAALEISLYSIVPDHGSSSHKVHTPARRLSRLYIHACKNCTREKRATVARNTVSGLVLIAKACGSDIPRLTFWMSNVVVLREVITGAFGNTSQSSLRKKMSEMNHSVNDKDSKSSSMRWTTKTDPKMSKKAGIIQFVEDWKETDTFTAALEKIESWMFSRIVESVWWQTITPHMQSPLDISRGKVTGRVTGPALGDQQQGTFSVDLWKHAFLDAFSRLCPVRAGGHKCGCLPILARMVMEQCVSRLDVAMFNAILRESASEIPTDPVSDPIVDPRVLPIPAGDLSFGSGAQLKNSIGNWSRCLADLFGTDTDDDRQVDGTDDNDIKSGDSETKIFRLLDSLSDLLMLPKDMLLDRSIRREVCPLIGNPLITRILCNFTPDEFCPDPVPGSVLEELNSESTLDRRLSKKGSFTSFPYAASPVVYSSPSAADVALKVADGGGKAELGRNASIIQRKGYTSDEDLDDLDSPLTSIMDRTPPVSPAIRNGYRNGNLSINGHVNLRFELLRQVWSV